MREHAHTHNKQTNDGANMHVNEAISFSMLTLKSPNFAQMDE